MGREGHLQCLAWGSLPHSSTKLVKNMPGDLRVNPRTGSRVRRDWFDSNHGAGPCKKHQGMLRAD